MSVDSNSVLSIKTFCQRIKSIQNLCSFETNYESSCNCVLFIFGQDASKRPNKFLFQLLRFLFIDSSLNDNDYEELRELVILIQSHSISVVWT